MTPTLELAKQQIEFARGYVLQLVEGIDDEMWFQMPAGAPTHIAWQIGHLAMAEYGLCLFRQRGRLDIDRQLMPSAFRKRFARGSTPAGDAESYPAPSAIRDALTAIHEQAMQEIVEFTDEQLAEPIDMPYAVHANKLGALLFCSHHEMIHAGQIGVIRRLLGFEPIR